MALQPDPSLDALWKRVLDAWEEEAPHLAFLEYCRATDRLVEAAVRYRGMTGDRDRAERAEKKLKSVAFLAMSQLEINRATERRPPRRYLSYGLLTFFMVATIGLLAYVLAAR